LFQFAVGDYRREWLWRGETTIAVDKSTGYTLVLDLGWWSDRMTYFLGRWYDLQAQLVIKEHIKPGATVIDVGANRGMFALYASKQVGPQGSVVCFEPNPSCRKVLEDTLLRNGITNVQMVGAGLSDRAEALDLIVPASDTGIGTFAAYDKSIPHKVVSCEVLVGDDALREVTPNFIKIDVEGFEARVIQGLSETIRRHRPLIYMEMVEQHLRRAGSSSREVITMMTKLDYEGRITDLPSRYPTTCSYLPLGDEVKRDCDVLWMPHA
jgi:FkbM family methyltransferase